MEMTKREYADKVAELIGGEVVETEKANGVKMLGIVKRNDGSNVSPTAYVDEFYRDETDVEFAAERINQLIEMNSRSSINVEDFKSWEKMKPLLRIRLYNQNTNSDVRESAEQYGFDDLVLIPYINLTEDFDGGQGSIKVTNQLIEYWGVTPEEVIQTAKENSKGDYTIQSMAEMIKSMMGLSKEDELPDGDAGMYVITNRKRLFGAYSVIEAREQLREMFSEGYIILPSSVHEVLVIPMDEKTTVDELTTMVQEVNETQVALEEQLGNKAYVFGKEVA